MVVLLNYSYHLFHIKDENDVVCTAFFLFSVVVTAAATTSTAEEKKNKNLQFEFHLFLK